MRRELELWKPFIGLSERDRLVPRGDARSAEELHNSSRDTRTPGVSWRSPVSNLDQFGRGAGPVQTTSRRKLLTRPIRSYPGTPISWDHDNMLSIQATRTKGARDFSSGTPQR